MRRIYLLLAVCLLLGGTLAFSGEKIKPDFDEITLNGERITSWDNIAGSGIQTQLDAKRDLTNLTFTGGPATFDNEVTAAQFSTTAADGEHFINVANSTAPTNNVTTGDCYYDNVTLGWLCWNGSAWAGASGDVTGSSSTVFTNKTLDAAATGNILKQTKYLYKSIPDYASTWVDNTAKQAMFSHSADKANNCAMWVTHVPDDLDNTVEISVRFAFTLLGADNAAHNYVIGMCSTPSSGYGRCGSYDELSNVVSLTYTGDAYGASYNQEIISWTTMTGWKTAAKPGEEWSIAVCRDGDTSDPSTVNSASSSIAIRYGSVQ